MRSSGRFITQPLENKHVLSCDAVIAASCIRLQSFSTICLPPNVSGLTVNTDRGIRLALSMSRESSSSQGRRASGETSARW
ncbi:hypothetical protein PR003_g6587 [Phytophthora rubi]|uniref:Uncharacterized protein n=1 Tax=Phytophthora rubi TaxID=129364 RepID=A0A6A4FP34_9STRA|nr:hypothetical protein PR003_g6587 [Phytophthora rubi]